MKLSKKHEKGQGLVEYALILVLVGIVVIGALTVLGPKVGQVFSDINNSIAGGTGGGLTIIPSGHIFSGWNDQGVDQPGCDAMPGYTWGTGDEGTGCYVY